MMIGMMIDIDPRFISAVSSTLANDLKQVKVMNMELLC